MVVLLQLSSEISVTPYPVFSINFLILIKSKSTLWIIR